MVKANAVQKPNILNKRNVDLALDTIGKTVKLLTNLNNKPIEKSKPMLSLDTPLPDNQIPQKGKNTPQIKKKLIKYKLSQNEAGIESKVHLRDKKVRNKGRML
jgi:hypothetical protein